MRSLKVEQSVCECVCLRVFVSVCQFNPPRHLRQQRLQSFPSKISLPPACSTSVHTTLATTTTTTAAAATTKTTTTTTTTTTTNSRQERVTSSPEGHPPLRRQQHPIALRWKFPPKGFVGQAYFLPRAGKHACYESYNFPTIFSK